MGFKGPGKHLLNIHLIQTNLISLSDEMTSWVDKGNSVDVICDI